MSKTFRTAEGYVIDYRLRQRMAPAMKRILELMESDNKRPVSDQDCAREAFCDRGVAKDCLNKLHDSGILRIAAYRRTGSTPQAMYAFAMGKADAVPPPPLTNAEKQRKRRVELKRKFGQYAWRVHTSRNFGGAEKLVVDGKVVYVRRPKA